MNTRELRANKAANETVDRITAIALRYIADHDKQYEFLMEADMRFPGLMQDCGSCDCLHPRWFAGDCRNDRFRF